MDYYLAIKRKESLIRGTTEINLENITISNISQTEKDKCDAIPLIPEIDNRDRKYNRIYQGLEKGKWELLFNGYKAYVQDDEKILETIAVMAKTNTQTNKQKQNRPEVGKGNPGTGNRMYKGLEVWMPMSEESREVASLVVLGREAGV